jgi:hypothetical protein
MRAKDKLASAAMRLQLGAAPECPSATQRMRCWADVLGECRPWEVPRLESSAFINPCRFVQHSRRAHRLL